MALTTAKEWLAEHPRMLGVLFTMLVLASQASVVIAGDSQAYEGP